MIWQKSLRYRHDGQKGQGNKMEMINIDKLLDDAEHFLGLELNEKKMETLNRMRDLCRAIAEIEPQVKSPFVPFYNKCRNASVMLEARNPFWTFDSRVLKLLAELLSMADNMSVCIVEGTDTIRIMCSIKDMWDKFGYDNDMEHGK